MIKEALMWFKENLTPLRPDSIHLADREFLRDPNAWKEVKSEITLKAAFWDIHGGNLALGTIESLIEFMLAKGTENTQIIVGQSCVIAYYDIDRELPREEIRSRHTHVLVPFIEYEDELEFTFRQFQDFLAQHYDRIHDKEALSAAVRSFKASEAAEMKIVEKGPIITYKTTAAKNIEGSEGMIPKEIVIDMPTGTREFLIPNTYLLRITTDEGLSFTLTRKQHDGSWEELVKRAFDKLRAGLPDVLILEGP